ncbi:MAG: hypothetical protein CMJ64_16180 [Planctomycetaceae bacterium]|nr:hypothetical protein [Planctomycetaceae bacterium]
MRVLMGYCSGSAFRFTPSTQQTCSVRPDHIHATVYTAMGTDPKLHLLDHSGRPIRTIEDPTSDRRVAVGRLGHRRSTLAEGTGSRLPFPALLVDVWRGATTVQRWSLSARETYKAVFISALFVDNAESARSVLEM